MDQITNFVEDTDLRRELLNLLKARLHLIEKDNLSPMGITIQTGRLKLEI